MSRKVNVIGVGMIKFAKPGASEEYNVMASKAAREALKDAAVAYEDIEQAYAGYVYGDSTCGQRAVYEVGLTGIPVFNVNNNCSTGSTALMLGKQAIEGGIAECVLVVGFEQMEKGALGSKFTDRTNPLDKHAGVMNDVQGFAQAPPAAQMFGGAGREYRWRYGTKKDTFGKVSFKARQHAARNPYAIFADPLTLDEIMNSPEVFDPLTRYQCCPPTCGAAAAVLCSEDYAKKKGISKPVYIAAQAMTTDYGSSFGDSMIKMVGYDMTVAAAKKVYEKSGVGPKDVDVVELHDCFTANEILTYEGLQRGRSREVHQRRSEHVRRQIRDESFGRFALEGPPTRRDGACTMHGIGLAASRTGRQASGAERARCAPAQLGSRRRVRRHDVPPGLMTTR
jgi:acetyl-CoA acetyltransferase